MSAQDYRFYLKRGDTLPILERPLLTPAGAAVNLTAATAVWLHIGLENSSTRISREMTVHGSPTAGLVRYTFLPGDWTDDPHLVAGVHRMEYEVLGAGDERQTYPNADIDPVTGNARPPYDELVSFDDLAQA